MRPAVLLLLAAPVFAQESQPSTREFRPPAVPLVVHDPYFSIWSPADRLTDAATVHWTGRRHALTCLVRIDGKAFRLMGNEPADVPALPQVAYADVQATTTCYEFRNEAVSVLMRFMTPALPEDLEVLARPVTYLRWLVRSQDGAAHDVALYLDVSPELCVDSPDQAVTWDRVAGKGVTAVRAGSKTQDVLGRRGDDLRIDWGHVLLATPEENTAELAIAPAATARSAFASSRKPTGDAGGAPLPAGKAPHLVWTQDLGAVVKSRDAFAMLAYDDEWSILYMDQRLRPFWRRGGRDAIELLEQAAVGSTGLSDRCAEFDERLRESLELLGGKEYARTALLAFRQCLGANKLCADAKGQPLLFPKENFSNGCIATVDVIYPMAPLFLALSADMSKAMLVPVLDYAMSPRWKFPFAPHDLGTYPHATGQVYGGGETGIENQMPVEESANLILLLAALRWVDGNADFALRYRPVLRTWAEYLKAHGLDPENQLCTDDFTGHLAHNVNLSAKAILALGAYAQLCVAFGRGAEGQEYRELAERFAAEWVARADDGDHTRLAFDKPGTWSQKYNLVWDRILDLKLFPEEIKAREVAFYRRVQHPYGLPLDSRADFTKIDWTHWSAALTGKREDLVALVEPMYRYLDKTPDRVPMCDWHDTRTARKVNMIARPVVGGVFIPLLNDMNSWRALAAHGAHAAKDWAPFPVVVYGKPFGTSETEPQTWEFTPTAPAGDWSKPGFESAGWQRGPGGFGSKGTPGAVVRTGWTSADLWLRREVTLAEVPNGLALRVHHDEDAEIYLNGVLAADPRGYTTSYQHLPIRPQARATLKPGPNLLAVHCRQTQGGQYVDVGFATRLPRSVLPVARGGGWLDQHLEINRIAATRMDVEIVFLGDSITQGFAGPGRSTGGPGKAAWELHFARRNAANFGIGGDSTQHLLWRIEHGNFAGIAPRTVMLMIGTNNLGAGHTPAEVAEGVAAILYQLRARIPAVKVLLLAVFPRGQKPDDPMRRKVQDLNQRLAAQADGKQVVFKDLASVFLANDGTARAELYAKDFLHLSAAGYEAWAAAVEQDL